MKFSKKRIEEDEIINEGIICMLDDEGCVHVSETEYFYQYRHDYVMKAKATSIFYYLAGAAILVLGAAIAFAVSEWAPDMYSTVMPLVAGLVFLGVIVGAVGFVKVHLAKNFRDNILESAQSVAQLNYDKRDELNTVKSISEDGRITFYDTLENQEHQAAIRAQKEQRREL